MMQFSSTTRSQASDVKDYLASVPVHGRTTVPTKTLQCMLLTGDGWFTARGRAWNIHNKRIGPGVYEVWVEER